MKPALLILGGLSAVLIVGQLVMGQLIAGGQAAYLIKAHQHSGYLTVVVTLVYLGLSLSVLASQPNQTRK